MKLLTYEAENGPRAAVLTEAGVVDAVPETGDARAIIISGRTPELSGEARPLAGLKLLGPIARPHRSPFAVGLNYKKHADETAERRGVAKGVYPEQPSFFCKWLGSYNHHEGDIIRHPCTDQLDYEGELVIVIGKGGIDIPKERALDHVYGYTIMNEITAREIQSLQKQRFKGKAMDTFGPVGPWIVTKDETGDGNRLGVETRVNGEVRQKSNTSDMIFSVETIVSILSEGLTLEPGDMIATGTPEGVGAAMSPRGFLKPGDVVECEVENIGILRNRVVAP